MAGLPSENEGIDEIPLLLRLNDAVALSFLSGPAGISWENVTNVTNRNKRLRNNLRLKRVIVMVKGIPGFLVT